MLERVFLRARATLPRSGRRALSTDEALSSVLAKVAKRIQAADPAAVQLPPGVRTEGPKMILQFTCTHAGADAPPPGTERTFTKVISKNAYENGAWRRGMEFPHYR